MKRRGLVPVECTESPLIIESPKFVLQPDELPFDNQVLYSDLLSSKGIWRQPLEVIVAPYNTRCGPRASLDVPIDAWFRRSEAVRQLQCATQITGNSLAGVVDPGYEPFPPNPVENDAAECSWMATKIVMGIFSHWSIEQLEQLDCSMMSEPERWGVHRLELELLLSLDQQNMLLDYMVEVGLAVRTSTP
ncbi:hypothetical protein BDD12DRAFT_860133 [Trichophaea hybrida]|nr:hypothetical protein BDD12DRAFT_860133 [Trichophaea hybrida]